jgi:hypothetical protein
MNIKTIVSILSVLAVAAGCSTDPKQSLEDLNMPIIQTKYTADPSPMIYKDTLFLYTSHDEDDGENFHMKDWLLYTTTDMVNWQDRGAVAGLRNFKWYRNSNGAWAQQVVERNG